MGGSHQATREDRGSVPLTPACTHSAAVVPGFLAGPDPWLCLPRDSLSWYQPGPFLLTSPAHWHLLADPPGWHPPGWDHPALCEWQLLPATQQNHLAAALGDPGTVPATPQPSQGTSVAKWWSLPLPLEPRCFAAAERTGQQLHPGLRGAATSACLLDVVTTVRTSPERWRWGMTGPMAPWHRLSPSQPHLPYIHESLRPSRGQQTREGPGKTRRRVRWGQGQVAAIVSTDSWYRGDKSNCPIGMKASLIPSISRKK